MADSDSLRTMAERLQRHVEKTNPWIWRPSSEGIRILGDELVAMISGKDCCVVVAEDPGDRAVGFAAGRVRSLERCGGMVAGSIERIYVEKQWRGRGIGSALVGQLCGFFRENEAGDLSVRYVVGNLEAQRFWERLGFQPRIVIAGIDREDLEKRLGAGSQSTA